MAEIDDLVAAAKSGDRDAMLQLWESVRQFAAMQAGRYYRQCQSVRTASFELEDLLQSAYLAFVGALQWHQPGRGSFLTAFDFFLRHEFKIATGLNRKTDAFLRASSLDAPVGTEEDTDALIDFIPDTVESPEEVAFRKLWNEQLHDALEAALKTLADDQSEVLRRHYFGGETQTEIAADRGVSHSAISAQEQAGLTHLRAQSRVLGLDQYIDLRTNFYQRVGVKSFQTTRESAVERIVFRRERRREQLAKNWIKGRRAK